MTDRTETCTPEERRLLDYMKRTPLMDCDAGYNRATLVFEGFPMGHGSGHDMLQTLYAVRGDKAVPPVDE